MSDKPTRLEAGTRHVLAYCVKCPPWRELRGQRTAALLAAADHLEYVHDALRKAADLREQARRIERRHADNS